MRRWRHTRLVRASAYRLGEALGDRVLIGTTSGGSPMALSMRDHQHRSIYFHGEHEPEITALFRRFLTPGAIVFDVGANAGYFSILTAELSGRAHAFEPNPGVRALLERSVALGSGEIVVVAAACSDCEGMVPLYLSDPGNTGMSSVRRPADGHGARIQVSTITLDAYAQSTGARPALIKVDVEGHEREALVGASRLLADVRPVVIAEVGTDATLELMRELDYEPHRIGAGGALSWHDGRLELVGGYENVCFTPREAHAASAAP
jgi:FkbM family methyltransferase